MAGKIEVLTMHAFAQRLGISDPTVRKYIEKKKIKESSLKRNAKGVPSIIYEKAIADLDAVRDPGQIRRTQAGLSVGGVTTMDAREPVPDKAQIQQIAEQAEVTETGEIKVDKKLTDMSKDPKDYTEAKIQEQIARAIKIKTEVKILLKTLVAQSDVDEALGALAVNLRSDLETLPGRLAAACAATDKPKEVEAMINKEIILILNKHSGKIWV